MQNLTKTDEVTEAENARRENTAEYEKKPALNLSSRKPTIFNDLERPLTYISSSRHTCFM